MCDLQETLDEYARQALDLSSKREYDEYNAELIEQLDLFAVLWSDLQFAEEQLQADEDKQFFRRTVVRTFVAMVEGAVSSLKQSVLTEHQFRGLPLKREEYAVLAEEAYRLKQSGEIDVRRSSPRLREDVKFTFPIYAKSLGGHFTFDPPLADDPGWQSFCGAIRIRNRLTHPKCPEDLAVADSELEEVRDAAAWFWNQHDRISAISDEWLKSILRKIPLDALGDKGSSAAGE